MTIAYPASGGSGGAVVGELGQVRACCPWCTTEGWGPYGPPKPPVPLEHASDHSRGTIRSSTVRM
eukprot:10001169-Alexandrium_andersonii.AAC.1